jgi:integrase
MPTVRLVIRKERADEAGRVQVYLRLAHADKMRYTALPVKVRSAHWNARTGRVRRTHGDADEVNARLAEIEAKVESAILLALSADPLRTPDELKAAMDRAVYGDGRSGDFFSYADAFVEGYLKRGQVGSWKRMAYGIRLFREFVGRDRLPFDQITPGLVRAFQSRLQERTSKVNSVSRILSSVKVTYQAAALDGLATGENPFQQVRMKSEKGRKVPLTREEFALVEEVKIKEGSGVWHTRNMFVFAVYMLGMRFQDVATLTWGSVVGGRLWYDMRKTGKPQNILIVPRALAILDMYRHRNEGPDSRVFPALDGQDLGTAELLNDAINRKTSLANNNLERIRKRCGIQKHITTHVARHTFTALALKLGWTVKEIQAALGHSSMQTTDSYLRDLRTDDLDDRLRVLF